MDRYKKNCIDFLVSALDTRNISDAKNWIALRNKATSVSLTRTSLKNISRWYLDEKTGSIQHDTGRFFSIDGIRVTATIGEIPTWDQPIINQPEIGILGFIVKELGGVLHFLVQAKIEPGNVNCVQLSPTIQATRSNFQQTHGGNGHEIAGNADIGQALAVVENASGVVLVVGRRGHVARLCAGQSKRRVGRAPQHGLCLYRLCHRWFCSVVEAAE